VPYDASQIATDLLTLALFWLFGGFAAATLARSRRHAVVGPPLVTVDGDRHLHRALLVLAAVALALALVGPHGPAPALALFACALAAGIVLQCPRPGAGVAGERGLALGWEAWPWEAVRSWRLLGRHLRVDVGDRWLALPVDAAGLAALEAHLEARLPERRSERS